MSATNHSRYYYLSNQNMSQVKEQYSMNFQDQSKGFSKNKQQISEMIASGSHTHTKFINSVSNNPQKKVIEKQTNNKPTTSTANNNNNYNSKYNNLQQYNSQPIAQQKNQPIFLGANIFKTIKERYQQVNKLLTQDPQVLYDFYLSQKKTFNSKNLKSLEQSLMKIKDLMPSMQRKMLIKIQFQKMLTYKNDDIYYTLCCFAQSLIKDKQLSQKVNILNMQMAKHQDKKKVNINSLVERLYEQPVQKKLKQNQMRQNIQTKQMSNQQKHNQLRKKRTIFGRNLSQHYQNSHRSHPQNIQTLQKLYNFWQDIYERQQYGIQWDEDTAKEAIREYMYDQVQQLFKYTNKKMGFKCFKADSLYKFYQQNPKLQGIYIPLESFKEYIKVYNQKIQNLQKQQIKKQQEKRKNSQMKKKQNDVKKVGRPVSATPLSYLAKPKSSPIIDQLAQKFTKDKLISTLAFEQHKKRPRHALDYGVYNVQDQIKIKQRIKPNPKQKFDETITKQLMKTFNNQSFTNSVFSKLAKKDRINSIFQQDYLQSNENWKNLGPVLHQAMAIRAYNLHKQKNPWFRNALLKYSQKSVQKDFKYDDDTTILNAIFKKLNECDEHDRKNQLSRFQNIINAVQAIEQKTQRINQMSGKDDKVKVFAKSHRICMGILQDKAKQYAQLMKNRDYDEQFSLRNYLNKIYQDLMKQHKDYIKHHYNAVQGQKEIPKLLKYEFFRIKKEINQFQGQRDNNPKSHIWVPSKRCPESFNYKTFNQFADIYKKDKNKIIAKPEKQSYKDSIWGRKNGKQRQKLMMTYEDAKQCTFHPKVSVIK